MAIFLCTFAIVYLFSSLADKYYKRSKLIFILNSLVVISALSFIAGVRDIGVGTDTAVYIQPEFERITQYNYSFPMLIALHGGSDILFWGYNYILVKIFKNINAVMFFIEFLISGLFYITALQLKKRKNIRIAFLMLIYSCVFYVETFNTMRQCIAVAFVALSIDYMMRERWIIYSVLTAIAVGFHSTAVVALAIPILYFVLKKRRHSEIYVALICTIVILAGAFYPQLLKLATSHGILSNHYLAYINEYVRDRINLSSTLIILNGMFLVLYAVSWKRIDKKEKYCYLYLAMALMDNILYFLNGISYSAYRIALYFGVYAQLVLIPSTVPFLKYKNRDVSTVFWTVYLTLYFIYKLIFIGWSGVYPYTSHILGIG